MADFAKLFHIEGIGQILVTLGQIDEERPACLFRIPDELDCEISMALSRGGPDNYEADLLFAQTCFDAVTAENVAATVETLTNARDALLAANGAN